MTVKEIVDDQAETADRNSDVSELLAKMNDRGTDFIVILGAGKFVGMVFKARILDHYRKELIRQNRRFQM
jgi:CBS-domain-containing membrane protein